MELDTRQKGEILLGVSLLVVAFGVFVLYLGGGDIPPESLVDAIQAFEQGIDLILEAFATEFILF